MLWGFRGVRECLLASILFHSLRLAREEPPFLFSKTNGFLYSGPTYFFLFLSVVLELFFLLPLERYISVGEVTQTHVHSPTHFPAGILPGSLWFLVGRHLVTVQPQSLLAGIHLVIILWLSFC